jgi:hypothetical protein
MMEQMNVKLSNVIFYYAKVYEPAQNYGKTANEFSVQCLIDKETMTKLKGLKVNKTFKNVEDEGLLEKYPEGKGRYLVSFKMPEFTSAGKPLSVRVVDTKGHGMTDLIGNGSKGEVLIWIYEGQGMSKGKMNSRLSAVKVDELVHFDRKEKAGEDFTFDHNDGFIEDTPF